MSPKFGRNYPVLSSRPGGGRNSDRDRLVFIAAAGLVFSLLVVLLVVMNFRSADARTAAVEPPSQAPAAVGMLTLLTPDRDVRSGSSLSEVTFKEVYWPRNQVPEGAIRDVGEMRGLFAKLDLKAGQPVTKGQITREARMATLPITPGNRAITIVNDEVTGLEGHAQPGTRVDVVLTYYQNGELTSKVIVQNARVISVGGDTQVASGERRERTGRRQASTLTLDVLPKDALEMQTARQLGKLSLIMRAQDDDKGVTVTEVSNSDISGPDKRTDGKTTARSCTKGRMRIDGKEYIIDCDGSINQLQGSSEP
jgi:pilus assembly protein CpaB